MRFLSPQTLWFLPAACLLPLIWYFIEKKANEKFSKFVSPNLLSHLLKIEGDSAHAWARLRKRRRVKLILGFLALVSGILALARPQVGTREETIPSEGLDMVFLLDVSNSMLAEDVVPSRLRKAKHILRNFVDHLSGDRVGVVAFAGSAYPAVPLTTDYDFVRQTSEVLDQNSVANQGSDLAKALQVSQGLLLRGGVTEDDPNVEGGETGSRVIIVLSDGESHEGEETKLVSKLKEKGIRVYSIGIGSLKGGPIPLRDQSGYMQGYKKDASGGIIHTKLESANLESIASKTGGKFYSASTNEGEVEEILGELQSLDRTTGEGRHVVVYDEVFQYPLALGIFFLMLMLFMRERPRAVMSSVIGVFLFFVAANAQAANSVSEYRETQKGVEAYNNKDYAGATQYFGKAQAENPDSAAQHLNLGDALLKSGSAEGAAAEFQKITKSPDANEAARGAYNLGKAFEAQKENEKALQAYQDGLDRLTDNPKADPEVVLRLKRGLEQAQQQKQQQKKEGEGKPKDDPKDKDKQDKDDKKDEKKENKNYKIPKRKPEFKPEKLTESDAKRILQQLQEQEKKGQQRLMRGKTGKPKDDKNTKDW